MQPMLVQPGLLLLLLLALGAGDATRRELQLTGGHCGGQLSSAADCAALTELSLAAPCLSNVAPDRLCLWQAKAFSQAILCVGGRVQKIYLENCGITSLPDSIGGLTTVNKEGLYTRWT